jgi:hypothetical protein
MTNEMVKECAIQDVCRQLVDREGVYRQTSLVELCILKEDDGTIFEKISNLYYVPEGNDPEDTEMKEIFEWWLVSDWFAEQLEEKGQPILDAFDCKWWGRCTTGQAIYMDGVIREIASDMEILPGQKFEWEVK